MLARKLMMGGGAAAARTYATWNPDDKSSAITLANDNLDSRNVAAAAWRSVRATQGKSSGKWYWELSFPSGLSNNGYFMPGIATSGAGLESYAGASLLGLSWHPTASNIFRNGSSNYASILAPDFVVTAGTNVLGCALDMDDAGGLWRIRVNDGAFVDIPNIKTITGTTVYPANSHHSTAGTQYVRANFGATAFAYSVPAGYNEGVYTT